MQDFLTNCANVLQKYGFSYLRGAGTTLLLALVGTFFGCLIGFAVGALQTIPIDKQRDPAWKRVLLRILVLTWPRRSAAASSPSTQARPRVPWLSA